MRSFNVKKVMISSAVMLSALLTACSSAPKQAASADVNAGTQVIKPSGFDQFLGFISPYRITIQQGNFVSEEMASQLKEGMTREQVRFILGTALLTDMFHEDRWDYPFRLQKPNGEVITTKLAVHFKNNTVEKFERGVLPTEKEYLAQITTAAVAVRNENMTPTEPQKKK